MLKNPNPEFLPISHEDEFLPPVSKWTVSGGIFLVTTIAIAFIISAVTPLPVTVKAPAVARPSGEIKLVQSPLEGIVTQINVQENQTVSKNTPLVILDASNLKTRQIQIENNLQQNSQQRKLIDEELKYLTIQINAETEKAKRAIAFAEADYLRINKEYDEKRLTIDAQMNEAQANLQIAKEDLTKSQSELKASEAILRASESALRIAQQKLDRYQTVAQSGALPQNQLEEAQLEVEQKQELLAQNQALLESQKQTVIRQAKAIESAEANLQAVLATVNPSNGLVTMAQEKIAQEKAIGEENIASLNQEKNRLLQRQNELEKQINNDNQELLQIQKEVGKTVVTAPRSGIILKLNLRNTNQVVLKGEEIAQILPSDTPLVIKARVSPQDISRVKLNQKAQMRVSAYPYPDYGIIKGTVIAISPDAIIPQNHQNTANTPIFPYYEVTLKPEQLYLKNDPKNTLQAGMEMQADIIAKNETVLKFILRKVRLLTYL